MRTIQAIALGNLPSIGVAPTRVISVLFSGRELSSKDCKADNCGLQRRNRERPSSHCNGHGRDDH